jgi:methylglutaconyl-CoA hydratase
MISTKIENRIAYITLDRAEKRNALNDEMVRALKSAFTNAYVNNDCKVIVLQAQGEVFSAGADLGYLQQLQENTFEENVEDSSELASLFKLIYTGPKVVVAAIQGHAIAGGCGLATVCDFSFAISEAKFGYTEVKIGFIPAIVSYFLLRKIGEAKTKELLLTGKLISASQAREIGMINFVVEDNLADEVEGFCQDLIANCSKQSLEKTKELIANLYDKNVEEAMSYTSQMNAKARATDDCKTGINAFLNKEKIQW